jgi:hypothetical protein
MIRKWSDIVKELWKVWEIEKWRCKSMSSERIGMNEQIVSDGLPPEVIRRLSKVAAGLQYGSITLVFHGGKVIQMERNEKLRLNSQKTP